MKLPKIKIGPKLADPPTDLDDNSQERLDSFMFFASHADMVKISKLVWLAVVSSPNVDFSGSGRFKNSGETVTLSPHTVLMTTQTAVGAKKVAYYIEHFRAGGEPGNVRVTDTGPGGWWHLDGLHRVLAARILGMDITAEIWR